MTWCLCRYVPLPLYRGAHFNLDLIFDVREFLKLPKELITLGLSALWLQHTHVKHFNVVEQHRSTFWPYYLEVQQLCLPILEWGFDKKNNMTTNVEVSGNQTQCRNYRFVFFLQIHKKLDDALTTDNAC